MGTRQSLSPDIPAIAQWVHEQRGYSSKDQGYEWTQQPRFLLTKDCSGHHHQQQS
jgi:hypothetical protein